MNKLNVDGVEVTLRKVETEHFDSALLSLATRLAKQGIEVTEIFARPHKADGFCNIEYQVFSGNNFVADSLLSMNNDEKAFLAYLAKEKEVNLDYDLNAKFFPYSGD